MVTRRKGREQTPAKRAAKPSKPYPDFPLFPHATGRWAKKIRGRFAFFGPWADPQGALARYVTQRDELYAGLVPRTKGRGGPVPGSSAPTLANGPTAPGVTLRDLVNHFLTAKERKLASDELSKRAFADYHTTCGLLVREFGVHRLVTDLTSSDFGTFRAKLAKTRGPVALGNQVNRVRIVFKYGYDAGLLERPVRFGPEFVRPPMRAVRLAKQARGPRLFEPAEIHLLLEAASPALRAMILLGINCGLGNTDLSELPIGALNLKTGMLDFPRPKTGIARRAVLWPETIEAIQAYLKVRPEGRVDEALVEAVAAAVLDQLARVAHDGLATPWRTQRENHRCTALLEPKRRGRSFHLAPLSRIQKMPRSARRLSIAGRPPLGDTGA